MTWRLHQRGADPERDKILARRFGRDHDKPCRRSKVLTCALWECQRANQCQNIVAGARKEPVMAETAQADETCPNCGRKVWNRKAHWVPGNYVVPAGWACPAPDTQREGG